jgi:hypothetical protein
MQPANLAALLRDPADACESLIRLRGILPQIDLSLLVAQDPTLLQPARAAKVAEVRSCALESAHPRTEYLRKASAKVVIVIFHTGPVYIFAS